MSIECKRAYEKPGPRDGRRVLVDGLWPRGMKKEDLKVERWMKDIAPSAKLRQWYGHQPEKWDEFRKRYTRELHEPPRAGLLDELVNLAKKGKLTLVFGARDRERCNASVIQELIQAKL